MRPRGTLRSTATLALPVVLLAVPAPVAAQVPDSVAADTTRADSVAVPRFAVSGLTVSVARAVTTTGGTSAISLELDSLRHEPAPTLERVMRDMPLVVIRQNSRGQTQPALRGSEDRQIAILMDGVPLTLGWDHRTDLSIIPLSAAGSINLIRGLSSVLHGPNVLGGVVEVDVARGDRPLAAPDPISASFSVDQVGGRSLGVTGGTLLGDGSGEWLVRAGAGYHERPGVVLPGGLVGAPGRRDAFLTRDGELRLNSDEERYDGFVSLRHRSDGGSWASFSGSAFTVERGVPPEAHVDEPRLWRYPRQDRLIAAATAGTGQRSTAWGTGDVEASVGVDVGRTRIDKYAAADYDRITGGEVGDDRTLTLRLLGDHTLGDRGDLRTAFTWADVTRDEVLDGTDVSEYRQRIWSAGAEMDWRLGDLPGIPGFHGTRVSGGVAVDGADTPESGDKPPLGTLWEWGGRLGFSSVTAGDRVLVHAGLSRRARFPALRELYSGALGRFEPNPDLEPEVLSAVEGGVTVRQGPHELQAVLFHQRLHDAIVRSTVTTPGGETRFKRINRDEIRSTGLELLGRAALGDLTISGDLTLQDVTGFTTGGEEIELEYEPTVAGKVGMGGPLPWDVVGSAGVRFMSDQLCENPEVGGLQPFETDPSVEIGLRRAFRTGRSGALSRIETSLTVDNLTDAAIFDQCGLPMPGRTIQLQVRFE